MHCRLRFTCYHLPVFRSRQTLTLPQKYLYSEIFWSVFSRIRTEYEEILRICLYSVQMLENTDQKNSEFGHAV